MNKIIFLLLAINFSIFANVYENLIGKSTSSLSREFFECRDNYCKVDERDYFNDKNLDEMIKSVEHGLVRPDATNKIDPRLKGIQNSLKMIDHLSSHISKMQTDIGVQSRRFDDTIARNEMLLVHTNELKSDIEDTDLAEASMRLQQNSLGYQAMLQTIQKLNGLNLVNNLK